MTILEALSDLITYPIKPGAYQQTIIKRGLNPSDEADRTMLNSPSYNLCYADLLVLEIEAINTSKEGRSISKAKEESLRELANDIYRKYGEEEVLQGKQPQITYLGDLY